MLRREIVMPRGLVTFAASSYGALMTFGLLARRPNTVLYGCVMAALIAVLVGVHLRVGLPDRLLWALALLGLLHLAGGLIPLGEGRILYNLRLAPYPLKYDRLVHALGSTIMSLVAWRMLRPHLPVTDRVPGVFVLLVGLAGMGVGAIAEVAEFMGSRLAPSNAGGYTNTGWDLVFNIVGCAVAAGWVRRRGNAVAMVRASVLSA